MTRKSRREIESTVEDMTAGGRPEYVRQAAAVVAGDRETVDAEPPATVDIDLVVRVGNAADGNLAAAWDVIAETAETPPPLADFTGART